MGHCLSSLTVFLLNMTALETRQHTIKVGRMRIGSMQVVALLACMQAVACRHACAGVWLSNVHVHAQMAVPVHVHVCVCTGGRDARVGMHAKVRARVQELFRLDSEGVSV